MRAPQVVSQLVREHEAETTRSLQQPVRAVRTRERTTPAEHPETIDPVRVGVSRERLRDSEDPGVVLPGVFRFHHPEQFDLANEAEGPRLRRVRPRMVGFAERHLQVADGQHRAGVAQHAPADGRAPSRARLREFARECRHARIHIPVLLRMVLHGDECHAQRGHRSHVEVVPALGREPGPARGGQGERALRVEFHDHAHARLQDVARYGGVEGSFEPALVDGQRDPSAGCVKLRPVRLHSVAEEGRRRPRPEAVDFVGGREDAKEGAPVGDQRYAALPVLRRLREIGVGHGHRDRGGVGHDERVPRDEIEPVATIRAGFGQRLVRADGHGDRGIGGVARRERHGGARRGARPHQDRIDRERPPLGEKREPDVEGRTLKYPGLDSGGSRSRRVLIVRSREAHGEGEGGLVPPEGQPFQTSQARERARGQSAQFVVLQIQFPQAGEVAEYARRKRLQPIIDQGEPFEPAETREHARGQVGDQVSRQIEHLQTGEIGEGPGGKGFQAVVLECEPLEAGERAQVVRAQFAEDSSGAGLEG